MTTKILSIGNSFSDDSHAYLYQIAAADDVDIKTVNLYIGGCSLELHCHNIDTGEACYEYRLNGEYTGQMSSILDGLKEEDWDYITIQQASHDSGILNSYYPYTEKLLAYIRSCCPNAKIYLHETWAYETDSDHDAFVRYDYSQDKMYAAVKSCYGQIQHEFHLPMIPSGDLIQTLRKTSAFDYANGEPSLCRDGFHMSLSYGRYALAALWYKILLNGDIEHNTWLPEEFKDQMTAEKIVLIKQVIENLS